MTNFTTESTESTENEEGTEIFYEFKTDDRVDETEDMPLFERLNARYGSGDQYDLYLAGDDSLRSVADASASDIREMLHLLRRCPALAKNLADACERLESVLLRPCPFCGGTEVKVRNVDDSLTTAYFVECFGCGCRSKLASRPEIARAAWNKRADHVTG